MSRRIRRNHQPAFKAKVALAALKGDFTTAPGNISWLVEAHRSHGYKQREIAEAAGISTASVSRLLKSA